MGSKSKSKSKTEVWDKQQPYLQDKFDRAQTAMDNYDPTEVKDFYSGMMNAGLDPQVEQYLRSQMGGTSTGQNWLKSFRNPKLDPAYTAYRDNLRDTWNEDLVPSMVGNDMLSGSMGNSRSQIGRAMASQKMGQSMNDFAAQTYGGQQNRSLAAASQFNQNQSGGAQNLGALQNNLWGIQNQGAQGLQGADWYGLNQYNNIIGAPTMTSEQSQTSGGGIGGALGTAAGFGSMFIPGGQMAGLGSMAMTGLSDLSGMFSGMFGQQPNTALQDAGGNALANTSPYTLGGGFMGNSLGQSSNLGGYSASFF